jgi:hypothetical protein
MKHSKVKLGVALLLCLALHSLHAQVAASASVAMLQVPEVR